MADPAYVLNSSLLHKNLERIECLGIRQFPGEFPFKVYSKTKFKFTSRQRTTTKWSNFRVCDAVPQIPYRYFWAIRASIHSEIPLISFDLSTNHGGEPLIPSLFSERLTKPDRPSRYAQTVAATSSACAAFVHLLLAIAWTLAFSAVPAPAAANGSVQSINLETSDGISLTMAFYPGPEEPVATVILVHDIGGSQASVRVLAAGLQKEGYAVAVPDLRGHGGSTSGRRKLSAKSLRQTDLQMITASGGGAIRQQAKISGDLETVYRWLKEQEATGEVNLDCLCVIGSGLGGTLASLWVATDWGWQPNTRGPQGQNVKALILISPKRADKGISINPALAARAFIDRQITQPILKKIPVMIVSGKNESAADRIFQQLKAARPMSWYKQPASGVKSQAENKNNRPIDTGPLVFVEIESTLRGDKLASLPSGNRTPLNLANWFIKETASQ